MSQAKNFISAAKNGGITPTGAIGRGWIAANLNDDGTVGNTAVAIAI